MTQPPANWYPDPSQAGQLRYWDGAQWTAHVAPGAPGAHAAAAPAPFDPAPRKKGLSAGWIVAIVIGAIIILIGPLTAIAIPVYLNQQHKEADSAAMASATNLAIAFSDYLVDHPSDPPTVASEGTSVTLTAPDGSTTVATLEDGVEYGGYELNDSYELCVWVHAPQGQVMDYQWSSSAGLAEGNCS